MGRCCVHAGVHAGAGRRCHTQLDAINKTFIQTTAAQGTIQILKKKEERKQEKYLQHFTSSCVYIHPLSMESPGFEICYQNENSSTEDSLTQVHILALLSP